MRMETVPLGRGTSRGRGKGYKLITAKQAIDADINCPPSLSPKTFNSVKEADKTPSQLASGTVTVALTSSSIPVAGNEVECVTNFVRLTRSKEAAVFEYKVSFSPALESSGEQRKVMKQLENILGPVQNFVGQSLYLPKKLENEINVLSAASPKTSGTEIRVTIKFVKEKPEHELSQFYDVLFERVLTSLGFIRFRRGFYELATIKDLQENKLQIWPGVSLTVEYKEGGLMIMMDTPRRVVRTNSAYDYFVAMVNSDPKTAKEKFTDFIVGKIVICKSNRKCYKVDDVAWELNPTSSFDFMNGKITFKDYYFWQYGIEIENLNQPMLVSRIKPVNRTNYALPAESVRTVVLISELCFFTGLTAEQKKNSKIMTDISIMTRLIPISRVNLIKSLIGRIRGDVKVYKILTEWGLSLDRVPITVEGKEIKPPCLQFHKSCKGKIVEPNFIKDAHKSCYDPKEICDFVIVCSKHDKDKAVQFAVHYREACAILGIRVRCNPNISIAEGDHPHNFVDQLRTLCPSQVQLAVVILPSHRDDLYRAVKVQCTKVSPIPNQCLLARTLHHRSMGKIALNIAIQINCKLGGAPWALRMPVKKIMFCGMDAAHDPTRKNPSVIAFIASMNDQCTRFFSRPNLLPIHQEVATCLKTMFMDALIEYRKENGTLPDHIIFYRDGGNAGSFETLKKFEVDICLEVLDEEKSRYSEVEGGEVKTINFSYICVAKRIPERIMMLSKNKDILNPVPGIVVDKIITQPWLYDFYIVSQLASKGTVTPTHYTVLYETNPTAPDLMQKITYSMTYMYYNFHGTIKVPAVVQYAHKLGQFCSRMKSLPNREMQMQLFYL